MSKKKKVILAILVLIFACPVIGCNQAEKQGSKFVKYALSEIDKTGGSVLISEIYPGDWTHVCVLQSESTGGHVDKEMLRKWFKLSTRAKLDLPYGVVSSSDWNWGIMFFTPPNKIEALYISNDEMLGDIRREPHDKVYPRCIEKDKAVIELLKIRKKNYNYNKLMVSSNNK